MDNMPKQRFYFRYTALIFLAIHKVCSQKIALTGEKQLAARHIAIIQTSPSTKSFPIENDKYSLKRN